MGAVLRSTCLLKPILRKYKNAHITWITLAQCKSLLAENPYIDRLLTLDSKTLPAILSLRFDVLFAVDKSLEAGGLALQVNSDIKKGFCIDAQGAIVPFDEDAQYQYDVGLNDELKFFINQKPETQQITESMGLDWKRDPYVLSLNSAELDRVQQYKAEMIAGLPKGNQLVGIIGYNTGCSLLFPFKKLTVDKSKKMIEMWRHQFPNHLVALLGGPEDDQRQLEIKKFFADDPWVYNTPVCAGLREGIVWMATSDLVFSGCSLGLHMAIALQKKVICWFGVSCIQEIDVYDRGVKIQSPVSCSPCWKKTCEEKKKCFDEVPLDQVMEASKTLLLNS